LKQEKVILDAGFPCALYELQQAFEDGWRLSQQREPIYIAGLYEIVVEKEESVEETPEVKPVAETQQPAAKRGPKPKG
jgi:hypothetical protein